MKVQGMKAHQKAQTDAENDFKFNHLAIIQKNSEISMLQYISGIHRQQ